MLEALTKYNVYRCDFFRQRPNSPVQCSFVATTADISDWSTVPKKSEDDLRNFQRPEMPGHVQEISEFFEKFDDNSSPSAIVLGFRDPVEVLDGSENKLDLTKIIDGNVVSGFIKIPYLEIPITGNLEEKRQVLRSLIKLIDKK